MTFLLYAAAIIAGLVVFVVIIFGALLLNLYIANRRQEKQIDKILEPIFNSIRDGKPDVGLINQHARDPGKRVFVYRLLGHLGRLDLFPAELANQQAIAESQLVQWLEHPNELKNAPDEIQFVQTVTLTGEGPIDTLVYYVFKYRTFPPHWAADKGWMAGVAGPYPAESDKVHVFPGGTFSEMENFGARTVQEHVRLMHNKMLRRGLKPEEAVGEVPEQKVTF